MLNIYFPILGRFLLNTGLSVIIMKRFTTAQRVQIISNFYESHKCMIHTLNALKNCGIVKIEKTEIQELVKRFESTGSVHDDALEAKRKREGSEDSLDDFFPDESEHPSNLSKISKLSSSFTEEGDYVVVYTDGACENNGKASAKAGIGVWFGDDHPLNISRPVQGKATNNTAEIQACVAALELLYREGVRKVRLKTDSQFTINCITQWIKKWKKNNWKLTTGGDVKNKEDLMKLDNIRNKMTHVDWVHIRGHSGEKGNEEADKLARQGALLYKNKFDLNFGRS
ncbi:ribonuclease H1-like [Coccinella septempunctata]|uniref:ribonuclease H1-like n=1 Tax=Coccinella septempunctata TaxID=41139 RepID=UPI001D0608BB|nr:ribonuclease H1-like [Coccinella septempunctata]